MPTGRNIQLTKQIGEYLVACELARRELLVATFSGNVPGFDILAVDADGHSIPIQVKTIHSGEWQFSIDRFVEVRFEGKRQILGSKLAPPIPKLVCVFVLATDYGKDQFFILEWEQLRDTAVSYYTAWLASKNGVRPRNYKSLHCALSPGDLAKFKDQWVTIAKRL